MIAPTAEHQLHQERRKRKPAAIGWLRGGALYRLSTFGSAIILSFIGLSEPRSLIYYVMHSGSGAILVVLMGVIGVVGLIDVFINDWLSEKYRWKWAKNHRHFVLIGLAFSYLAQLYVAYYGFRSTGILLFYLWNTLTILLTTFVDATQRSEDAQCLLILE